MVILIALLIISAAIFALMIASHWMRISWDVQDNIMIFGHIFGALSSLALVSLSVVAVANNTTTQYEIAELANRREAIVYCMNDNTGNSITLREDISNFNDDIDFYNNYHDNFWIGLFVDKKYKDVEKIELK